jgi:hypothetical protein
MPKHIDGEKRCITLTCENHPEVSETFYGSGRVENAELSYDAGWRDEAGDAIIRNNPKCYCPRCLNEDVKRPFVEAIPQAPKPSTFMDASRRGFLVGAGATLAATPAMAQIFGPVTGGGSTGGGGGGGGGGLQLSINVMDSRFAGGATGDGTTDDTAAIQAAINFGVAALAEISFPYPPGGFYLITAPLTIPSIYQSWATSFYSSNWSLRGYAGSGIRIRQQTDNTPVFLFQCRNSGEAWTSFRVENFQFEWARQQTFPANIDSYGIAWDCTQAAYEGGFYECTFRELTNVNGCRLMGWRQANNINNSTYGGIGFTGPYLGATFGPVTLTTTAPTPAGSTTLFFAGGVPTSVVAGSPVGYSLVVDKTGAPLTRIIDGAYITATTGTTVDIAGYISPVIGSGVQTGDQITFYSIRPSGGAMWGCLFERLFGEYTSTGCLVNMNGANGGQPNVHMSHLYLNQWAYLNAINITTPVASGNVLTFPTALPPGIIYTMLVEDWSDNVQFTPPVPVGAPSSQVRYTGNRIPFGTYVQSVSGNQLTMTQNVVGGGVLANDSIVISQLQWEPALDLTGANNCVVDNMELNFTNALFANLQNAPQCHMRDIRLEGARLTDGGSAASGNVGNDSFAMSHSDLTIENLEMSPYYIQHLKPRNIVNCNFYCRVSISGLRMPRTNYQSFTMGQWNVYDDANASPGGGGSHFLFANSEDFGASNFGLLGSQSVGASCVSQRVMSFYTNSLAGTASVANSAPSNVIDEVIQQECWIFSLELFVDQPLTGGSIVAQIYKNGALLDPSTAVPTISNFNVTLQPLVTNASSAIGTTSLSFASAVPSWVQPGMFVYDMTHPAGLAPSSYPIAQVQSVSGTTVNLTTPVGGSPSQGVGVSSGDSIFFTNNPISSANSQVMTAVLAGGSTINTINATYPLTPGIVPGTLIYDVTTAGVIPVGTTVSTVDFSIGQLTLSTPAVGAGIGLYDTIAFAPAPPPSTSTSAEFFLAGKTYAASQCKNLIIANGAYKLLPGDRVHIQFVTTGFTSAVTANAKALITVGELGIRGAF